MSHDPFQDLFDRGIPRSSTASTTRATLDSLTPQFERAKSRRRSRVGAIAAFAVLGTTGGAAALGVGPVALGNRPSVDFNNGLAGGNEAEAPPQVVESTTTTSTTTTVTTTIPSMVSTFTIPTPSPDANNAVETSNDSAATGPDITSDSNGSDQTDGSGSDSGDSKDQESSASDSTSDSSSSGKEDSSSESDESSSDVPVAGPLTKSTDDGSVIVDVGSNGLVLVEVSPEPGVSYQVDAKPDEISIEFRNTASGSELSSLDFKLVDGGITVEVEASSS